MCSLFDRLKNKKINRKFHFLWSANFNRAKFDFKYVQPFIQPAVPGFWVRVRGVSRLGAPSVLLFNYNVESPTIEKLRLFLFFIAPQAL